MTNDQQPPSVTIDNTNSVMVGCPACASQGRQQNLLVAVHLPTADLMVACQTCNSIAAQIGVGLPAYRWAVNKFMAREENEPSRIIKPTLVPPKLGPN